MPFFNEYDVVKVVKLLKAERYIDGSAALKRQPRIGDEGTILHIPPNLSDPPEMMIVECSDPEGQVIWIADFSPEELVVLIPFAP
jgi:hypothetical protein